jgi:hypothetical protein
MDSGARHQQTAEGWKSADGKNRKPLNCSGQQKKRRRRFVISASFSINAPRWRTKKMADAATVV